LQGIFYFYGCLRVSSLEAMTEDPGSSGKVDYIINSNNPNDERK